MPQEEGDVNLGRGEHPRAAAERHKPAIIRPPLLPVALRGLSKILNPRAEFPVHSGQLPSVRICQRKTGAEANCSTGPDLLFFRAVAHEPLAHPINFEKTGGRASRRLLSPHRRVACAANSSELFGAVIHGPSAHPQIMKI